jgi:hypothetical protein
MAWSVFGEVHLAASTQLCHLGTRQDISPDFSLLRSTSFFFDFRRLELAKLI